MQSAVVPASWLGSRRVSSRAGSSTGTAFDSGTATAKCEPSEKKRSVSSAEKASFSLLGRIAFFTYGADEVKSWVIPAGSKAPRAAAAIHNDFERGFIKAEVVSFADFKACGDTVPSLSTGRVVTFARSSTSSRRAATGSSSRRSATSASSTRRSTIA